MDIQKKVGVMTKVMGGLLLWAVLSLGGPAHAGTVTYVYTDPQGTPLADADANGNITATFDYAPYGKQALGTAPNGPGYTGHVNDPDTGLVYMQARYYDPAIGRFLSTDPVTPVAGNLSNFNRFAYASNNPVKNADPDGRESAALTMMGVSALQSDLNHISPATAKTAIWLEASILLGPVAGEAIGLVKTTITINKTLSDSPVPTDKTFTTYTRTKTDNTVYSGRTSGKGTPEQQVTARTRSPDHQAKTAEGYGPAKVDRNSSNPDAIRGREQQLIEQNGGARSQDGTSGNAINGVSPSNPSATRYSAACSREFGCG